MASLLLFKHSGLEAELREKTHPELRQLLLDLGGACARFGLHEPVLTCLGRTPEENAAVNGLLGSFHLFDCAADLRKWVWDEETQLPQVLTWLRGAMARRGGKKRWGLKVHDAGSGDHIHVQVDDAPWRATYEKRGTS